MKYYLAPIKCNKCDFKSRSILRLLIHLKKEHKTNFTKQDWKFAIKHFFPFRLLIAFLIIVFNAIILLINLITYPFWILHEITK